MTPVVLPDLLLAGKWCYLVLHTYTNDTSRVEHHLLYFWQVNVEILLHTYTKDTSRVEHHLLYIW